MTLLISVMSYIGYVYCVIEKSHWIGALLEGAGKHQY